MENRSDFIPTPEFLKSEIGIPIKRNFPAGRESLQNSLSLVESEPILTWVLSKPEFGF